MQGQPQMAQMVFIKVFLPHGSVSLTGTLQCVF